MDHLYDQHGCGYLCLRLEKNEGEKIERTLTLGSLGERLVDDVLYRWTGRYPSRLVQRMG